MAKCDGPYKATQEGVGDLAFAVARRDEAGCPNDAEGEFTVEVAGVDTVGQACERCLGTVPLFALQRAERVA